VCERAKVKPTKKAPDLTGEEIERLHVALGEVKVLAPPATCVVPITEGLIVEGLKRRYRDCAYFSATRPPAVYRGNPFVVECGIAYGGDLPAEEPAEVLRFANRVPLQYQPKACAISEAVYELNWKNYGLSQPRGSLPVGPLAIFVHLASVWVPFTSEAKEAVAHYPELLREITLALQECGRRLAQSLRAQARAESNAKRRSLFERYIPELGQSLGKITGQERNGIEKFFLRALANFVNLEVPEPEAPPSSGSPPGANGVPAPLSSDDSGEEPPSTGKPSKGKGTEKATAAKGKGPKASEKSKGTAKGKAAGKKATSVKGEQLRLLD
jgi:DNA topoisomerase VI subunit B